jgi:hypothetical protein
MSYEGRAGDRRDCPQRCCLPRVDSLVCPRFSNRAALP